MGYRRERKVYKLVFEDPQYEGLEIRAASIPVGKLLKLANVGDLNNVTQEELSAIFEVFAGALISWNLEEDDGTPVPTTVDGLYTLEIDFIMQIISAWMEAVAGVPGPLRQRSSNGSRSVEQSLPMETL